jgi:hypothetical protein
LLAANWSQYHGNCQTSARVLNASFPVAAHARNRFSPSVYHSSVPLARRPSRSIGPADDRVRSNARDARSVIRARWAVSSCPAYSFRYTIPQPDLSNAYVPS